MARKIKHLSNQSGASSPKARYGKAVPRVIQIPTIHLENLSVITPPSIKILENPVKGLSSVKAIKPVPTPRSNGIRAFMSPGRALHSLPWRSLICAKRKIRKQVLFALGLQGKNGTGGSYRRTLTSNYHCGA